MTSVKGNTVGRLTAQAPVDHTKTAAGANASFVSDDANSHAAISASSSDDIVDLGEIHVTVYGDTQDLSPSTKTEQLLSTTDEVLNSNAAELISYVPIIGNVVSGARAVNAVAQGNYASAVMYGLEVVPAGKYVSKGVQGVAKLGNAAFKAVKQVELPRLYRSKPDVTPKTSAHDGMKVAGKEKNNNGNNGNDGNNGNNKKVRKRMPKVDVPCFKPVNTKKAHSKAQDNIRANNPKGAENWTTKEWLEYETERQLKEQQKGLNNMTAGEYRAGRQHFLKNGRVDDPVTRQEAIDKFEREYRRRREREYGDKGFDRVEAESNALQDFDSIRDTLHVLHNPDNVVGGAKSAAEMEVGLDSVNSSIGSLFNKPGIDSSGRLTKRSRVGTIDKAVISQADDVLMNVDLKVCK